MKPTPGPWTAAVYKVTESMVERMKLGSLHHAVCTNTDPESPRELLVALCGDEPGIDSQSAVDARLIAAAPSMFDFLKTLWVESMDRGDHATAIRIATIINPIENGGDE